MHSGILPRSTLGHLKDYGYAKVLPGGSLIFSLVIDFCILRNVEFGISLPLPEDPEGRDNADQLSKNDKSLTEQISILFKTIKTVEERAGSQNIGKIRLAISSPLRPLLFRGSPRTTTI
jgi:hypothetical protein